MEIPEICRCYCSLCVFFFLYFYGSVSVNVWGGTAISQTLSRVFSSPAFWLNSTLGCSFTITPKKKKKNLPRLSAWQMKWDLSIWQPQGKREVRGCATAERERDRKAGGEKREQVFLCRYSCGAAAPEGLHLPRLLPLSPLSSPASSLSSFFFCFVKHLALFCFFVRFSKSRGNCGGARFYFPPRGTPRCESLTVKDLKKKDPNLTFIVLNKR